MTNLQEATTGRKCQCGGQLVSDVHLEALDDENLNNEAMVVLTLTCRDCSAVADPEPWQSQRIETLAAKFWRRWTMRTSIKELKG